MNPDEITLPDFYDGTSGEPFQDYYRGLFLNAVARREPAVLKWLKREVWDKYPGLEQREQRGELLRDIGPKVLAERFNLTADWILHFAESAMGLWSGDKGWFEVRGWPSSPGWSGAKYYTDDQIARVPPKVTWDLLIEPWVEFQARAVSEFEKFLCDYRNQVTTFAIRQGYKKTPRKRSRDSRDRLIAFEYLALYQVLEYSCERIAAEFDSECPCPKKDAIMKQIHWAARAIDFALRPQVRSGRPKDPLG